MRFHHTDIPGRRQRATRLALPAMFAGFVALWIAGCATAPEDDLADLPTLAEVRSQVTPPQPPRSASQQQQRRSPRVDIMLEQVELPLDVPPEALWEHVDERAIDTATRSLWHANGLRVGVVRPGRFPHFRDELLERQLMGVRRQRISSRGEHVALRAGDRLREPVTVHTSGATRNELGTYQAERGRLRLLARKQAGQDGFVHLQLLPQHHRRRHAVQPRHPYETELDGEIFEDLGAVLTLAGNELLVIGLHDPWPERAAADAHDDNEDQDDEHTEANDTRTFELRPADPQAHGSVLPTPSRLRQSWIETYGQRPELPAHFGRSLLTTQRSEQGIQVLMLISVRPPATRRAGRD